MSKRNSRFIFFFFLFCTVKYFKTRCVNNNFIILLLCFNDNVIKNVLLLPCGHIAAAPCSSPQHNRSFNTQCRKTSLDPRHVYYTTSLPFYAVCGENLVCQRTKSVSSLMSIDDDSQQREFFQKKKK